MFSQLEQVMRGVTSGDKAVSRLGSVGNTAQLVANVFIIVAVGMSLSSIAYSFIQFATSTGDEDAVDKAKTTLTWGVLGMLMAVLAYTLKNLLLRTTGLDKEIL